MESLEILQKVDELRQPRAIDAVVQRQFRQIIEEKYWRSVNLLEDWKLITSMRRRRRRIPATTRRNARTNAGEIQLQGLERTLTLL